MQELTDAVSLVDAIVAIAANISVLVVSVLTSRALRRRLGDPPKE